ncbi:hypothetical protein CCP2SC5_510018 [Azospirillaceae bacterium]
MLHSHLEYSQLKKWLITLNESNEGEKNYLLYQRPYETLHCALERMFPHCFWNSF